MAQNLNISSNYATAATPKLPTPKPPKGMTEEQVKQLNKMQDKAMHNDLNAGRKFGEPASSLSPQERRKLAQQMQEDKAFKRQFGKDLAKEKAKQAAAVQTPASKAAAAGTGAAAAQKAAAAGTGAAPKTSKFAKFLSKIPKKGWIGVAVLAAGLAIAGYNYSKKGSEANEEDLGLISKKKSDEDTSSTQVTTITIPGMKKPDVVTPYRPDYDPNNEEQSEDESEDESAADTVAVQVPKVVTVQNGETVSSIAKKYNVSAEKIRELNADKIKIFQRLKGTCQTESFVVGTEIKLSEDT